MSRIRIYPEDARGLDTAVMKGIGYRRWVSAAAVTSLKMETDGPFDRDIEAIEELIRRKY